MQVDQDINCRTVGRCTHGDPIDRELDTLITEEKDGTVKNQSKHFLYVRYNADLSQQGLDKLGLFHIKSDKVREMDSVKYLDELQEVGKAAAKEVSLKHFGAFVKKDMITIS
jgi:hypothetical protein